MKIMKKVLSAVLVLALALSFTACGEKAPATESKAPESETSSEAPKEKVTLTYWSMWNNTEPQAKAIQEQVDKWCAETGNTVNIEWKGRDIKTIIEASLGAKEEIDIFEHDYQKISTVLNKQCFDLTEMANKAGYEDFCVKAFPTAVKGWADGKLVTIAYQPYTSGIFYNKAAFKKANIDKEPATWAEFIEVCKKLKAAGLEPLALDDAYVDYSFSYHLARYLGQDAIKELSMNGGWGKNELVKKAAQDMVDLKKNGYLSKNAPGTFPEGENEIGYDESAMVVNASWVPGEITNNTKCDIEWGMFNYPTVEGGKDPSTIANVGAQGLAIPAYSKNAEAAFDLIMRLTSGEGDQAIATATNGIPADTRNADWPKLIAGCREPFNALTNVYDWNCGMTENGEKKDGIKEACLKLFEGKYDAKAFVDALDALYK